MNRLPASQRDILEVIVRERSVHRRELPDLSGYGLRAVAAGLTALRQLALIERAGGHYTATERGKIALAIIIGKESRARARRRALDGLPSRMAA
jgi:hypothetical protein